MDAAMTNPPNIEGELRIDLDALAELARKATPGPWEATPWHDGDDLNRVTIAAPGLDVILATVWPFMRAAGPLPAEANAAFIAALDPQTVLALIDMARRAVVPSEKTEPVAWTSQSHLDFLRSSTPSAASMHNRRDELMGWTVPLYALDPGEPK